jgi:outer membrane protein assembly factor BamB
VKLSAGEIKKSQNRGGGVISPGSMSHNCTHANRPANMSNAEAPRSVSKYQITFPMFLRWRTLLWVSLASGTLAIPAPCEAQTFLTNSWSMETAASDSSPAVGADGSIYFGTFDGKLWALKADGSRKWVFRAQREIKSSPAIGIDGTVYFGSRDRRFYAVTADGKKRWDLLTGGWVDSSPALARDGTIYFGSWDKSFYALNPDGSRKWQFQTPGEIVSSPAVGADGAIYFGSHDGKFYALAPDGKKKWEFATGGPIISSPALKKSECLYFTSVDGSFYALNLEGSLKWRLRTGGITESSPVIGGDGTIYVGVNNLLWAVSPEGRKIWDRGLGGLIEASPMALSGGLVCCISRSGRLEILASGTELRSSSWLGGGYGYACPGIGPPGALYLHDSGVRFVALASNEPLAHSPWPRFRGNARNTGNINDGG